MTFFKKIETRYNETAQDIIVHHSSYVVYLEVARIAFLKDRGCDINALEKEKIFCPVASITLEYLKPLYSQEEIKVEVSVESMTKVRFTLSYRILREEQLIATGKTSHCFTNALFKPIRIPLTAFYALEAAKKSQMP